MVDTVARKRRARRTFHQIARQDRHALVVFRSNQHIEAQVVDYKAGVATVLASASSNEKSFRGTVKGKKSDIAKAVGKLVAERAKKAGVEELAFHRNGFKYHGRVKALAEGAREGGINI